MMTTNVIPVNFERWRTIFEHDALGGRLVIDMSSNFQLRISLTDKKMMMTHTLKFIDAMHACVELSTQFFSQSGKSHE